MRRAFVAVLLAGILAAGCGGVDRPEEKAPVTLSQPEVTVTPGPASVPPDVAVKKPAPLRGYPAPEIAGQDVRSGETVSLSQFKGKVVLVNFWATWCPPCRKEMPDLQALQDELGEKVKVLAIGGDPNEPADKLLAYADNQQLTFTILFDRGKGIQEYRALALPTTFVVDQNGIIREKIQGSLTLEQMRQVVARTEEAAKRPQ